MITDHVFRRADNAVRDSDRCAYMNCRRPRQHHERASERGDVVAEALQARRS